MKDSISLMKMAAKHASDLLWCAVELRHNVRAGSKAELEAELLFRYAQEAENVISVISAGIDIEDLDFKLKLSDMYGKNVSD